MSKQPIDIEQFSLATRRKSESGMTLIDAKAAARLADDATMQPATANAAATLPRLSEEERRRRAAKLAGDQQEARRRLKNLKRAKERALRSYVNVPLEQAVKERLMRAAHENDVKMTVILQAAIDIYLQDNGY
ncbi:hypothetical protein [Rhizobium grahamii]|uniref:Uncharacterized protein n=1 Tax=Rhizobium grahamii CCGE 502 TaxID=990285 RepID=S3ID73_9HYPH|nr:hypothetical protein [Rhizobium grahamii]EPE97088.1 hypothetical protein RGCCGE502_17030 [Rhizobium grahamii CCGE 502]